MATYGRPADTAAAAAAARLGRLLPHDVADPSQPPADREDAPAVLFQVQAAVPLRGKRAFTVRAPLTATFAELKRLIARQEKLFPSGDQDAPDRLTLRVDLSDEFCANDASPFSMGFDFAPLLHVAGFAHEYYLRVRGSSQRWSAAWWPHVTATDLVRAVQARLSPFDLRSCRIVVERSAAESSTSAAAAPMRVEIPIADTFRYAAGIELPESTTLSEFRRLRGVARAGALARFADVAINAGFNLTQLGIDEDDFRSASSAAAASQGPITFVRSQDGRRVEFTVRLTVPGNSGESRVTLGDVKRAVEAFVLAEADLHAKDKSPWDDPPRPTNRPGEAPTSTMLTVELAVSRADAEHAVNASVPEHEYPEVAVRDPYADLRQPFDDDDEEIAPDGNHRLYCHDHDLLVRDHAATKALCNELRFMRDGGDVAAALRKIEAAIRQRPLTLSFSPPANQYAAVTLPTFVDPIDNFRIPHLSDLGVFPGTDVFVEFYHAHSQQWSNEMAQALVADGRLADDEPKLQSTSTALRIPVVVTRADAVAPRYVTVKNIRGAVHRFAAVADRTTMHDLSLLNFCATGDPPMFHLLIADGGRAVNPQEFAAPRTADRIAAERLPAPTVYVVHRPRPWIGEPPDVLPTFKVAGSADAMLNPLEAPTK